MNRGEGRQQGLRWQGDIGRVSVLQGACTFTTG